MDSDGIGTSVWIAVAVVVIVVAGVSVWYLAGAGGPGEEEKEFGDPIIFCEIGPEKGFASDWPNRSREAIKFCIRRMRKNGFIPIEYGGKLHRVEFRSRSADLLKPDRIQEEARKAIQEGAKILHTNWPGPTKACMAAAEGEDVIILTDAFPDSVFGRQAEPNMVMDEMHRYQMMSASAKFMLNRLGWKDIVAIGSNQPDPRDHAMVLEKYWQHYGGNSFQTEFYPMESESITSLLRRVRDLDVDGVVVVASWSPQMETILNDANDIGWDIAEGEGGPRCIAVGGCNITPFTLRALKSWDYIDNMITIGMFNPLVVGSDMANDETIEELATEWNQEFDDPTSKFGYLAWMGMFRFKTVIKAAKETKSGDPDDWNQWIKYDHNKDNPLTLDINPTYYYEKQGFLGMKWAATYYDITEDHTYPYTKYIPCPNIYELKPSPDEFSPGEEHDPPEPPVFSE